MTNTTFAEEDTDKLATLRALIEGEPDVRHVLELEELADGRFRYLIETPFETFPRFVIGTTDEANEDVRITFRCGAEWNARREWNGEERES